MDSFAPPSRRPDVHGMCTPPSRLATRCSLALLSAFSVATPAAAQIGNSDGLFVAGTFQFTAGGWPFPGTSGMFLVHPRTAGNPSR